MDNIARACLLMQIVNVLRAQENAVAEIPLELGQNKVSRIWFCRRSSTTAHGVELPDEPGIAPPSIRRSNFFYSVVTPEPVNSAESSNSALRADSSTGQNEHALG
ncbi:MAG TPA: hypothetical protein VG498_14925 [Terriglobales bacterium]|nr:hypothetical protein [Terriglobales bacterium]